MSLEYKGYVAGPIAYDPDDKAFHGTVAGLRDVVHFTATTARGIERAFRESIDDYLALCAERGEPPDRAFSGKVPLRISPDLHRKAAKRAAAEGISLNQWLAKRIEAA
ncbi:MAG: type II toxin-antitoxin system HicB family antitoxin [Alphaproteobacteria bacterium]